MIDVCTVALEQIAHHVDERDDIVHQRPELLPMRANALDEIVQDLVAEREREIETRRVDALYDRSLGEHRVIGRARIDRDELLAEHALRRDVEQRVVVDRVFDVAIDADA